jgi:hypothetical protein
MQITPLDEGAVLDTVEAVFSAPEYEWGRNWWAWVDYLPDISLAPLRPYLIAFAVALIAYLIVREVMRRRLATPGMVPGKRGARSAVADPWQLAQELAARGEFTDAAHTLHRALLEALASRDAVRLHPAKTTGDYLRELRTRAAPLRAPFHEFSRAYDVVAFGLVPCDASRYARLNELARPLISSGG